MVTNRKKPDVVYRDCLNCSQQQAELGHCTQAGAELCPRVLFGVPHICCSLSCLPCGPDYRILDWKSNVRSNYWVTKPGWG